MTDLLPPPPTARAQPPVRSGVTHHRRGLFARWNAWRKQSPLNPYWLAMRSLHRAVRAMSGLASGRLLDVGVGERPYAAYFAHVDRYVGIEYPPAIVDKEPLFWDVVAGRLHGRVDVFGDGARLPFADASFDTVMATEVLEHLPDPRIALREMVRVLRPGGVALVTVPFTEPLHFLPQDYWRFTPSGLRRLAHEAGLVVERIDPRGNSTLAVHANLSQWILRTFAARRTQLDGSIVTARLRMALVMPVVAAVQTVAWVLSRWTRDESHPLGYWMAARKPSRRDARTRG
jgi:ubiquinone/menaquinone biosynthesis C-methylase UbiE